MSLKTIWSRCRSCRQLVNIDGDLGIQTVTCPYCGVEWTWSPHENRRRILLLTALALVLVLLGTIGGLWWHQEGMLFDCADRLAISANALQRGDCGTAEKSLREVETELANGSPWYWLPTTRIRGASLQEKATAQRTKLDEALDQEEKISTWGKALARSGESLRNEDYGTANRDLSSLEATLAESRQWKRLPMIAGKLDALLNDARLQRKELEETVQYIARVRSILNTVHNHLSKSAFDQASASLRQALTETKSDPVLESAAAYVDRLSKEKGSWTAKNGAALEQMAQQGLEWKKTRLKHTGEQYVAFLEKHPGSPFAAEAKARLVDAEVAGIFRGAHELLPPAERIGEPLGRSYSIINIHNDTPYELTLGYSGPDSFATTFEPGEKGSLEVLVGSYRTAARVKADDVRHFAGHEKSTGDNYQVAYFIFTEKLPASPKPGFPRFTSRPPSEKINLEGKFVPWPAKRVLPSYLK